MRRAALIYNPASGQKHAGRTKVIARVAAVLRHAGVEVVPTPTTSPGSAGTLARLAVTAGCDTILACGGDGTVHEILQGMAGLSASLGVIPLGTANALAADLGLPRNPIRAAEMLIHAETVPIPLGAVHFHDAEGAAHSRYFIVAAGAGVDAFFFAQLDSRLKRRFGYAAYLVAALRLWATHDFPIFRTTFTSHASGQTRRENVSQVLAVRIANFGGLVRKLAPGAALGSNRLHVIAFRTRSRLRYLRFMSAVWFARHTYSEEIELLECASLECHDLDDAPRSMVEADGELLGYLPARIELASESLSLLIPATK